MRNGGYTGDDPSIQPHAICCETTTPHRASAIELRITQALKDGANPSNYESEWGAGYCAGMQAMALIIRTVIDGLHNKPLTDT